MHSYFLTTKLIKAVANDGVDLDLIIRYSWVGRKKVHVQNFVAAKSVFWGVLYCFVLLSICLGAKDLGVSGSIDLVWSGSVRSP